MKTNVLLLIGIIFAIVLFSGCLEYTSSPNTGYKNMENNQITLAVGEKKIISDAWSDCFALSCVQSESYNSFCVEDSSIAEVVQGSEEKVEGTSHIYTTKIYLVGKTPGETKGARLGVVGGVFYPSNCNLIRSDSKVFAIAESELNTNPVKIIVAP